MPLFRLTEIDDDLNELDIRTRFITWADSGPWCLVSCFPCFLVLVMEAASYPRSVGLGDHVLRGCALRLQRAGVTARPQLQCEVRRTSAVELEALAFACDSTVLACTWRQFQKATHAGRTE